MIRAVAFDLDGLMFDTEALFFEVSSLALAARGKSFTPEIMQAMLGRRSIEVAHALKTLAGLEEPVDDLLAELREHFAARMDTAVHPTAGLFILLDRLKRRRLPIAVATSSRRAYTERLLCRHRLEDRFEFVLTSEDVSRGKPDPEIYIRAAERFGVPAESMLVLEDSPSGVAAAKAAGARVVVVPHEHSPASGLTAADLVVTRLDDPALLHLIDGQGRETDPDEPQP
jgi:beta-phosphoglucomutase-like phosphatase (HAD superfamily)